MVDRQTRRAVVSLLAGIASAGLAGCSDGVESEPTESADDPTPTATLTDTESTATASETDTESTPTETDTESTPTETDTEPTATPEQTPTEEPGTPTANPRPAVDSYLAEVDNYDGTIVGARGRSQITVGVAVEANGGHFGFGPPAVHVDNGATVLWEWTGEGGGHTVVSADDGPLDSGDAVAEPGVNYSYTFESDGIYNYHCAPHQSLGMKGSIIVGDDYPTTE